ncbi:hypothetical protein ACEPAF_2068 [Sanghuangporus sanghuang]
MGSSSSHRRGDDKQSGNRKDTISGTDRHESAKGKDKRPKLVKLQDAEKQIDQHTKSIRKGHIIPLMTRVKIYIHQGDAINQLGQALRDVARKLKAMNDAEERVREIFKKIIDRDNAEQDRPRGLRLPEPEYVRAENVRKNCEDDLKSSVNELFEIYNQAKHSVENGIRAEYNITATSKQNQENKEFADFLGNTTLYAANNYKKLENMEKVLGIANEASGALDVLINISDWPATSQLIADFDKHQATWKKTLAGIKDGVIEKSLIDEAKKNMADIQSRAEKMKAYVNEKENLKKKKNAAEKKLETKMREIRKLSEPLKKEVKK